MALALATGQAPQEWFSAAELAELALPGLPGDKRSITRRAREERWAAQTDAQGELLARPRRGRGGGIEFHADVLPAPARIELARRGVLAPTLETGGDQGVVTR